MKHLIQKVVIGFVLSLSILFAKTVTVEGTTVTFESPAEFVPLSEEIIAYKWPSSHAPHYAIGNETASTTIAYDYKTDVAGAGLSDLKEHFTYSFNSANPGIEWIENEIITLDGQEWLMFEMASNAIDTDIHNILLATILDNKLLIFNFNSVEEDFKKYESALRESIASIRFNR